MYIGVPAFFFFLGGGGAERLLPNFKGAESHEAPPWLAPSEKMFEHLEPLDCRKRRFQSINSTFLVRSFRCTNEGLFVTIRYYYDYSLSQFDKACKIKN